MYIRLPLNVILWTLDLTDLSYAEEIGESRHLLALGVNN
jgi:hypothetical protein